MKYTFISKIGPITIVSKNQKITEIILNSSDLTTSEPDELVLRTKLEIEAYLDGRLKQFSVPVQLNLTEFQNQVLLTMKDIPYGQTWTYELLAKEAGFPKAYRAVGSACKKNPLPIIIPCHRVVKKNGGVGSYQFGKELKTYLINQEKKVLKF